MPATASSKAPTAAMPRRPTRERKSQGVSISGQPLATPSAITSSDIEALEANMTAKQIKLARLLASDPPLSQAEAFRQAYPTDLEHNAPGIHRMASEACNHPKISSLAKLIVATKRQQDKAVWLNREQVRLDLANDLRRYAHKAEAAGDIRSAIAATKAAGETVFVRLFAQAEPDSHRQETNDVIAELLKRFTTAGAIDVVATPAEIEE